MLYLILYKPFGSIFFQIKRKSEFVMDAFERQQEDWKRFKELSDIYGWNINTIFTKLFYDSLRWMESNKSQLPDLKAHVEELKPRSKYETN